MIFGYDLSNFLPHTTKEIILTVLVFLLLGCVLLWNKALMKCRDINLSYVEEQRVFEKYLTINQLDEDFKAFQKNVFVSRLTGDKDV